MPDIARRFQENPLLSPKDLKPSTNKLQIACLLNPAVYIFEKKIYLLVRVAESVMRKENSIAFQFLDELGTLEIFEVAVDHPELLANDPRIMNYKGSDYLTTLSHLRLLSSDDGLNFYEQANNTIWPKGKLERFGIEDCRVSFIEGTYYLTYTAVSDHGVGVGLRTTRDWKNFEYHGMILPPHNKDCAIFDELIEGQFYALHRPSSLALGGNFIWLATSPDGIHWGNHKCIAKTRPGMWDSERIGAGAAPIKTGCGWLEIYHGADAKQQYCLGAFLMDLNDPSIMISRTKEPIMIPKEHYECNGFFGNVIFTNGHYVKGDVLTIYYGAADEVVCGAEFSINEILSYLK